MRGPSWTGKEISSLIHQAKEEHKKLPQISIPNRTYAAISNMLVALRRSGRLKDKELRKLQGWKRSSITKLKELKKQGISEWDIARNNLLGGECRSYYSIRKKMVRLDPKAKKSKTQKRTPRSKPQAPQTPKVIARIMPPELVKRYTLFMDL